MKTWRQIYNMATQDEREEITILLLARLESCRRKAARQRRYQDTIRLLPYPLINRRAAPRYHEIGDQRNPQSQKYHRWLMLYLPLLALQFLLIPFLPVHPSSIIVAWTVTILAAVTFVGFFPLRMGMSKSEKHRSPPVSYV
ncbi:MAG: hypothetical protein CVU44_11110 [Chloroflexi bacterium HGW-Chloroflexi-6]|nr:MAG: hypothetical protein CVU44_11110 [Chloroflexi bacterium HGW-Chloroflexi-6]